MINGDMIAHAFVAGRAFPVMFFVAQDSPPSRFVIMDGKKHFHAIPCNCGKEPRVEYSMDRRPFQVDGTEFVTLGCSDCKRGFTLFIGAALFDKARGAMGSVLRSWWNASIDKEKHPNDHGESGGLVATWEDFDRHMKLGTVSDEAPQIEATDPAEPGVSANGAEEEK